jgi:histone H3
MTHNLIHKMSQIDVDDQTSINTDDTDTSDGKSSYTSEKSWISESDTESDDTTNESIDTIRVGNVDNRGAGKETRKIKIPADKVNDKEISDGAINSDDESTDKTTVINGDSVLNESESEIETFDNEVEKTKTHRKPNDDEVSSSMKKIKRRKRNAFPKWLQEIKYYQSTTHLLLPKLPFERLVREITQDYAIHQRFTQDSIEALQTAAESYLIELFEDSNIRAIDNGRDTIMITDMVREKKKARLHY